MKPTIAIDPFAPTRPADVRAESLKEIARKCRWVYIPFGTTREINEVNVLVVDISDQRTSRRFLFSGYLNLIESTTYPAREAIKDDESIPTEEDLYAGEVVVVLERQYSDRGLRTIPELIGEQSRERVRGLQMAVLPSPWGFERMGLISQRIAYLQDKRAELSDPIALAVCEAMIDGDKELFRSLRQWAIEKQSEAQSARSNPNALGRKFITDQEADWFAWVGMDPGPYLDVRGADYTHVEPAAVSGPQIMQLSPALEQAILSGHARSDELAAAMQRNEELQQQNTDLGDRLSQLEDIVLKLAVPLADPAAPGAPSTPPPASEQSTRPQQQAPRGSGQPRNQNTR